MAILSLLRLPPNQYVIAGSGSMVMQGVERDRPMGDLDVFVSTRLWFKMYEARRLRVPHWSLFTTDPEDPKKRSDPPYLHATIHGFPVHIFFQWRHRSMGNIDLGFWFLNAVMVDDIPCADLRFIFDWKREVGREKDQADVALLARHLGEA